MKWFKAILSGLLISFLGTLPLGTLNLTALQLSAVEGIDPALQFSIGALLVEMCYVRITLVAADWMRKQEKWLLYLDRIGFVLILLLALSNFYLALADSPVEVTSSSVKGSRFLMGMAMSAFNPIQFPFWMGWTIFLFSRKWLESAESIYWAYILAIGIGTFLGNGVFIWGGRLLTGSALDKGPGLNVSIGLAFLVAAALQWKRMRKNKILG
jgi:threonine/homoserine/homoserine lactone efflux protein